MTSRHALVTADGFTHASSVIPLVRRSEGASLIVTRPLVPLKTKALPNLPWVVQVTPLPSVPVLLLPETSATVVPAPSATPQAAARRATAFGVVALATLEYGPRLPAASVARTR